MPCPDDGYRQDGCRLRDHRRGQADLSAPDDYVQRMGPFDRAARLKSAGPVSEEDFLRHAGQCVLAWNDAEKRAVASCFESIRPNLEVLRLPFPDKVYLVKTSGNDEGGGIHPRHRRRLSPCAKCRDDKLISHELFHVLAANPNCGKGCMPPSAS